MGGRRRGGGAVVALVAAVVAVALVVATAAAAAAAAASAAAADYDHDDGHEGGWPRRILGVAKPTLAHHKDLLPLSGWDWWGFCSAAVGLMIAAGGGIGGGGILVPIYILVLRFHAKYAIPLSNITIFGGAITNMALNLNKRHPLADRPLVDWDLILVMEPLTIGGALIGSFVNKVLPEEILTVFLVVLLIYTAKRTLAKGMKAYAKESKAIEESHVKLSELATLHENEGAEDEEEESMLLLSTGQEVDAGGLGKGTDGGDGSSLSELEKIQEEERKTPMDKVATLTAVFIVVLAVNLLKGGGAFQSPIGIKCGSFSFWAATGFILLWIVFVSWRVRDYLIKRWRLKERLGYRYVEGDVAWDPVATIRYPAICAFAGFFAGLFGIGGGIVKGPLMLEMGVHPQVASATSATMILYTSFTATTSFIAFGLLTADYAIVLFLIGIAATAVGQIGVNYMVERYKRQSLIILSIGAVVALSAALMGGQGLYSFAFRAEPGQAHAASAGGGGFCGGGAH